MEGMLFLLKLQEPTTYRNYLDYASLFNREWYY